VSEEIVPASAGYDPATLARGEPSLPSEFTWRGDRLLVGTTRRTWRSTKDDRGDTYVKRHYFEFETAGGRIAVVYFERQARRGEPRWFLYTIEE